MQLTPILAVALGSALGGVGRYLVATGLATRSTGFPVATLVVNVLGSFLLGLLVRALVPPGSGGGAAPASWLFLTVGFCGGFTTFSAFSLDTVRLLEEGASGRAAAYVAASVGLSVVAVYGGLMAGRWLTRTG